MTDAIQGIVGRLWRDAGVCQMGSLFSMSRSLVNG